MKVYIKDITFRKRHRKEMGDLPALAKSIERLGLLQPIALDTVYNLIAGERRIEAYRILGLTQIEAHIVDLDAGLSVEGEHDENECRKPFTPSERVAILAAIEEHNKSRQGQRTDVPQLRDGRPEVPSGERTREANAKKAGFASSSSARKAKEVVEKGTPELKEAMDSGEITITDAASVVDLPPEVQTQAIEDVRSGKEKTVAAAAKGRSKNDVKDDLNKFFFGKGVPLFDELKLMHRQTKFGATVKDVLDDLKTIVRTA